MNALNACILAVAEGNRHRQMKGEVIGDRRKQRRKIAGLRRDIRAGHVEGEPVREKAACVSQSKSSVAQCVRVKLQSGKSVSVAPKAGSDEIQGIFEVAALGLEMMGTEIHSF